VGRYSYTHSLTSALDEGEWSTSCPGRFTPKKRAPGTNWIRGWAGPRAGVDAVSKIKIPRPKKNACFCFWSACKMFRKIDGLNNMKFVKTQSD
jgi:hypothetical protein